jgi:transcriptional regulator with XRE-family HTH domain
MNQNIGKNIRALRDKQKISQETLAEYLNITRVEISYFETGARNIPSNLVTKIAELFAVDEYDLYETDVTLTQTNLAFAFRANNITVEDLKEIASFKKIATNYLKMQIAKSSDDK